MVGWASKYIILHFEVSRVPLSYTSFCLHTKDHLQVSTYHIPFVKKQIQLLFKITKINMWLVCQLISCILNIYNYRLMNRRILYKVFIAFWSFVNTCCSRCSEAEHSPQGTLSWWKLSCCKWRSPAECFT